MDTLIIWGLIVTALAIIAIGAAFAMIVVVLFSVQRSIASLQKTMADAEAVMKVFSTGAGDIMTQLIQEAAKTTAYLRQVQEQGGGVPRDVRAIFQRDRAMGPGGINGAPPEEPASEEDRAFIPDSFENWADE